MKSRDEFISGTIRFMDKYLRNARSVDGELLKELSDFAKSTELYKNEKDQADFEDYSYDDVFNHMCIKINQTPDLAVYCAVLCIPFIYDKWIQKRGA